MPRARRARKKPSNVVIEFEKEVKTVQKELELRYDAVCRNAELPSDESEHLFRAMLAYALGSDYDTFMDRRKRVAKKSDPQSGSATTAKRRILEPKTFSPVAPVQKVNRKLSKQIISVSSDDEPEPSPSPVQKKGHRKKAVSVVQIDDTPVLKKSSKRKMSNCENEAEPAKNVAMEVEPAAKKGAYSKRTAIGHESPREESPKMSEQVARDDTTDMAVIEVSDSPDEKQSEKKAIAITENAKQQEKVADVGRSMQEDKENRFAVSKDGKLSEAAIKRFKKPAATDAKSNDGVGKSIRLFKPALRPAGKRAQAGVKERRTESEMRLAAKTPGMGKLEFGSMKAATSVKPAPNISNDVTADVIALSLKSPGRNARKKISFAPNPIEFEAPPAPEPLHDTVADDDEDKILPIAEEEENQGKPNPGSERTGDKDVAVVPDEKPEATHEKHLEPTVHEEEAHNEIVPSNSNEKGGQEEEVAPSVQDEPEPKKKFSIEPLFPPSIFAAPSPTPKKKTISFAPGTKKRSSDSMEPQQESGTASKRARPTTLTGKSDLRKRIDSMRERISQKSIGSPSQRLLTYSPTDNSTVPASQETDSSGFFSAKSRAKCSSSDGDEEMEVEVNPADHRTPHTGTASRTPEEQFEHSPTPERSLSIRTPARALEERFNSSSPENAIIAKSAVVQIRVQQDGDGDAVMKGADGSASSSQQSGGPGVLSNLMTSVKSFLPSAMAIPGFQAVDKEETEEEKAKRLERERKEDEERREAETIARREAAKQVRQAEAREKQRRVEEKRRAIELETQRKEEEKRQKELARTQRLRQENEERKRKKAEEDRKRELKRQRVRAHQEKVAAEEAAKRAALEKKLAAARMAQAAKFNAKMKMGGSSKAPMSERKAPLSAMKGQATPGAQKQLFKKKSLEVTSYEMSADRERGNYSDDSSSESEEVKARRKGKKIPDWATKNNVAKAVNQQRTDPDKHFTRIQGVNLEDVFASTNQQKMRYRSRNSSGQWTKDRLTAKEEMEYKKKSGYI